MDAEVQDSSEDHPSGAVADYAELGGGAAPTEEPLVQTNVAAAEPTVTEQYNDRLADYAAERLQPKGEETAEDEGEAEKTEKTVVGSISAELDEKLGAYAIALQLRAKGESSNEDQEAQA